tara:strand:- start:19065 stop:19310 length:246 start_codon:yes stop_codon:yes gene_type:complete
MTNEQKLILLLSRVLNLEIEEISNSTSPENTSSWDSFNALVLVTELESEFDVSFSMDEVFEITCVGDIRAALIKHNINLDQ